MCSLSPYHNLWTGISKLFMPAGVEEIMIDDFIRTLDIGIALRVLADRGENLPLPLRWHHQDLIDGGWASLEDVTDIDRRDTIINHTMLVGRLQDHVGVHTVSGFDAWLAGRGLPQTTPYVRIKPDGTLIHEKLTLPGAVRNMIHHPDLSTTCLRQRPPPQPPNLFSGLLGHSLRRYPD